MTTTWLPGAKVRDLSGFVTNGPFKTFLGVILHVNVDEAGTPITFWGPNNSASVVPNFQVFKDGSCDQMLPFDRQPWCQIDGNFNYAAIETAGLPGEPLTAAQMATIARILAIYHTEYGMPLVLANKPGDKGFGTHQMGGVPWGGHACPGPIRAGQRQQILDLVQGKGDIMATLDADDLAAIADAVWAKKLTSASDGKPYAASAFLINANLWSGRALTAAQEAQKALTTAGTGVVAKLAALVARKSTAPAGTVQVTGTLNLGDES